MKDKVIGSLMIVLAVVMYIAALNLNIHLNLALSMGIASAYVGFIGAYKIVK